MMERPGEEAEREQQRENRAERRGSVPEAPHEAASR
jgi:hypothetical protein